MSLPLLPFKNHVMMLARKFPIALICLVVSIFAFCMDDVLHYVTTLKNFAGKFSSWIVLTILAFLIFTIGSCSSVRTGAFSVIHQCSTILDSGASHSFSTIRVISIF